MQLTTGNPTVDEIEIVQQNQLGSYEVINDVPVLII